MLGLARAWGACAVTHQWGLGPGLGGTGRSSLPGLPVQQIWVLSVAHFRLSDCDSLLNASISDADKEYRQ